MNVRTITYQCRTTDGTGTAGPLLTPWFQEWAVSRGLVLVPGTFNLCAHRDIETPPEFIRLAQWDSALALPARKATPGYDPRLYFVVLDNRYPAWLFRWCDTMHLGNFVGDTTGCRATRRCELVAETQLSSKLPAKPDGRVDLRFV
jgi:hypothetical protein